MRSWTGKARKATVWICLLLLGCFFISCGLSDDGDDAFGRKNRAIKEDSGTNPLKMAIDLVGFKSRRFFHRPAVLRGYRMIGRVPLIDRFQASPFFMAVWANRMSGMLENAAGPYEALRALGELLNYKPGDYRFYDKKITLEDAYKKISIKKGVDPGTIEEIRSGGLPEFLDEALGRLLFETYLAAGLVEKSLKGLSEPEKRRIKKEPFRYIFSDRKRPRFFTASTGYQQEMLKTAEKIDFFGLYSAGVMVLGASMRFVDEMSRHAERIAKMQKGILLDIRTPLGRLVVTGPGDDLIRTGGGIVVDLGGNDLYLGPEDGKEPGYINSIIDLQGNDRYNGGKKSSLFGSGCLNIDLLMDVKGDDRYVSGDMSQGSGICGMGILVDLSGNDLYRAGLLSQGFGLFGFGLLFDSSGDDRYLSGGMGQGAASSKGLGLLVDKAGSDRYIADNSRSNGFLFPDDWSHSQGAGFSIRSPDWRKGLSIYGGIGILADEKGDDLYYSSGGNCMGAGYFMSAGILVDSQGNDRYISAKGKGIGFGVHFASGLLLEKDGDDFYSGSESGGYGADHSTGMLVDVKGNDLYGPSEEFLYSSLKKDPEYSNRSESELRLEAKKRMSAFSFGVAKKPEGFGILIDMAGNDRYSSARLGSNRGAGGVIPPERPDLWPAAVLLDSGGDDRYSDPEKDDGKCLLYDEHALFYDTSKKIGWNSIQDMAKGSFVSYDIRSKDLLFNQGRLKGGTDTKNACNLIKNAVRADNILDLMEEIERSIYRPGAEACAGRFLDAKDPLAAEYAALLLAKKGGDSAIEILKEAYLKNEKIRPSILDAAGQVSSDGAQDFLLEVLESSKDPVTRLAAARACYGKTSGKLRQALKPLLSDSDPLVRYYAVVGMRGRIKDNSIINLLLKMADSDTSPYVRRAAGLVLAENGMKEGLSVLIRSLKYRSIDTFDYYGHDLVKEVAYLCGVDFPEDLRYDPMTWEKWWKENEERIDLEKNIRTKEEIIKAFAARDEQKGVEIFERLRLKEPGNLMIKRRYKNFLRERIDYRLLRSEDISEEAINRAIYLQKIALSLDPGSRKEKARLAYYMSIKERMRTGDVQE